MREEALMEVDSTAIDGEGSSARKLRELKLASFATLQNLTSNTSTSAILVTLVWLFDFLQLMLFALR